MLDNSSRVVLVDALVHRRLRTMKLSRYPSIEVYANFSYISLEELQQGEDDATLYQKDVYAFARTAYEVSAKHRASLQVPDQLFLQLATGDFVHARRGKLMRQVLERLSQGDHLNSALVEEWLWNTLQPCFQKAGKRPKIGVVRSQIQQAMLH
jgi:hypothetical protein